MVFAAGCGEEDDDYQAGGDIPFPGFGSDDSSGGSTVSEIGISGTPPSKIYNDAALNFVPEVSNPDDIELTFSASNLPDWATIDQRTGRLSGTPQRSDIGTYNNIRIRVAGAGTLITSAPFNIEVMSNAIGTASLSWQAPTQTTNGRPLTNLAGYRIYWGTSPSNLNQSTTVNGSGATAFVVDELTPATWYFATSAYNTDGIEGPLSQVVSKTVQLSDPT